MNKQTPLTKKDKKKLRQDNEFYIQGMKDKEKEMLEDELEWLKDYYKEHKTCIQCENGKYNILQRINQINKG